MLAVVHHDQHILGSQDIQQGLQHRPARGSTASRSDREVAGATASESVTAGSSVTQTHLRTVQQLGGHLQAQPGLAAPASPGQGDQASRFHQGPDLGYLPVPADEGRQLGGEIVRQRRVAQRAQRRELCSQTRTSQLEDPFRAR